jgi:[ribosomal protein S5]-alanine N-acetyltransferase
MIDCDTPIQFEGGWFRALRADDVHAGYVDGLNDPEVNRFLVGVRQTRQTTEGVKAFIESNRRSGDALLIGVWREGDAHHCGTLRLHGIEHSNHTAHVGICLFDKSVWGKGLATRAIRAVTAWAQKKYGLRWIEAGVYEGNTGSEKAFRAAGYDFIYDIPDKYLYDGKPIRVRVLAARGATS